jgi:hypothetical protein
MSPSLRALRALLQTLSTFLLILVAWAVSSRAADPSPLPPTDLPGLRYTNSFFPGTSYRPAIPTPDVLLGFPAAERAATAAEIERCLHAWTNAAPDRTRLVEYARSHENRPLHYLVLASPANLARLDAIQSDLARLADPRTLPESEAAALIERLPGVVWLGHTIHGDETEGSDAALVLAHHLLAAEDPAVASLFERLIVVIDPLMNPDGRDRFLKMIAEHRGQTPNVDEQSLLHSGYWPWGRGNHYLFDLNRDLLFAEHPETRGRIRAVSAWNPVVFVDAHGMGAQDTHLFSPPREPINPNIPLHRRIWAELFAADQAAAFDRRGLVYYSGEWNEDWYPGYADGWACYRGAIGILYEQARIAADGVRRPEGRILSYRESVLHHVVGAVANLTTASTHVRKLLAGFHATRREAVDPAGRFAQRTFAVPPSANQSRWREFADLLRLQGFELHTNRTAFNVTGAVDQLGTAQPDLALPAGTLLIPNRQPLAHLLAAFLEFDPRMPDRAVEEERRELLRRGSSRIYDITAWNLTMAYGLPAYTLPTDLPTNSAPYTPSTPPTPTAPALAHTQPPVAWIFDGADDRSLAAAARLLEQGVQVRAADASFVLDHRTFARGSILITRLDNRTFTGDLPPLLARTAAELELDLHALASGLGAGELPDLGGGRFLRLEPPRIATLGRDGSSFTDYGSVWFTLDRRLGIRHSQLDGRRGADFARYNVVILPERSPSETAELVGPLKEWVQSGGTLIAIGSSTTPFLSEKAEFSRVRALPDVLNRLPDFEMAILREWQGRFGAVPDPTNLWTSTPPLRLEYPWQLAEGTPTDEKELKKRDAWQSLFMPEGSFFATRVDTNHWLTAGCPEPLPVLAGRIPILMAGEGAEAPIRFGLLSKALADRSDPSDRSDRSDRSDQTNQTDRVQAPAPKALRVGWAALPPEARLQLRMSGLVWPEATHRFAHSAWVTRESLGRGQIILFASSPTFRAGARGTARVFLNAVVLGPGLGASTPLRP